MVWVLKHRFLAAARLPLPFGLNRLATTEAPMCCAGVQALVSHSCKKDMIGKKK
jgi:hypothetical protein